MQSKTVAVVAALALVLAGAPLSIAVVFAVVATPATAEEYRTQFCQGALPMSGVWRPPYLTGYARVAGSGFGPRFHPIDKQWRLHAGVDLVSQPPGAPVVAAADGTVTATGWSDTGGNTVTIDHGGGISTRYLHLAGPSPLTPGQQVKAGEQVGLEGSTGAVTGSHLHFEVHVDGEPVDPEPFMAARGAALTGHPVAPPPSLTPDLPPQGEGGVGFDLPQPGQPRQASLTNPPLPIPERIQRLYEQAGQEYGIPWTLLAGIGMAETAHGANTGVSSAGARGIMQFLPATFTTYGVDGDGDGLAQIDNDADSIHSAANYLHALGVKRGPEGVREALFAYNRADWYVNDVLYYAHAYGGGVVLGDPMHCDDLGGNPNLPPVDEERVATMLSFAAAQAGKPYVLGAAGPDAWDCSSLVQAALARIGITAPRTAQAQRDWLAMGNGFRVPADQARPGDLFFYDSYLGPHTIGHVGFVWDPANYTSIEAFNPANGVGFFDYGHAMGNNLFEVWRVGDISDQGEPMTP